MPRNKKDAPPKDEETDDELDDEAEEREDYYDEDEPHEKPKPDDKQKALKNECGVPPASFSLATNELKTFLEVATSVLEEGTLTLADNNLSITQMDASQIALVNASVPVKMEGDTSGGLVEKTQFCVNFLDLNKIVSRLSDKQITASVDKELVIKSGSDEFAIPLLEGSSVLPRLPKIEGLQEIKTSGLRAALTKAALISSYAILVVQDGAFIVEAHGDNGRFKTVVEKALGATNLRVMFPLEYLLDFARPFGLNSATIALKSEAPCRITTKIGEVKTEFWLAPRVESV